VKPKAEKRVVTGTTQAGWAELGPALQVVRAARLVSRPAP